MDNDSRKGHLEYMIKKQKKSQSEFERLYLHGTGYLTDFKKEKKKV